MSKNKKKPFSTLAVHGNGETSTFSIDGEPGYWLDPSQDAINWSILNVYGVSDSEDDLDKIDEGDFSSFAKIGEIFGCHIAKSLITNLHYDTYTACDDECGDLESMYSALMEHDDYEEIDVEVDNIYYIHEVSISPEYQGMGYEKIILNQLPAIIVSFLHIFPDLLMYFPTPTKYDEPKRDEEAEAILMHRLEYRYKNIAKDKSESNIRMFPPMREVPMEEVNRFLGRRNPKSEIPKENRNQELYKLYKSVGFEEIGKTGWLLKRICDISS